MTADRGDTSSPFAGELLKKLANDGRFVLDRTLADAAIGHLQNTLSLTQARLRMLRLWQQRRHSPEELTADVVDAIFVEQLAPGQLAEAVIELPKYIEALQLARNQILPDNAP